MTVNQQLDRAVAEHRHVRGGMRFGADFFGWLTATGTAVTLTGLAMAAGAIVRATSDGANDALTRAAREPQTAGVVGAGVVAVVLFAAYYCGGFVAGRMVRVAGGRQGVGVWLWAILAAAAVAGAGALAGGRFDLLGRLNELPRIPIPEGHLAMTGLTASIAAAVVALVGAVCGGLAGVHASRNGAVDAS